MSIPKEGLGIFKRNPGMIDFPYKKLVVWGLRSTFHTHRYIHQHFHENAKKLGIPTVWTEDRASQADQVQQGDLVIALGAAGKNLPIKDCVDYCLHNFDEHPKIDPSHYLQLQVYTNDAERSGEKWDAATLFDRCSRTLYQPWGTDLLGSEFKAPIFSRLPVVIWVGSVWNNDANQGNIKQIAELRKVLRNRGLQYIQLQWVPNAINMAAVRFSRIAPAFGGAWQVEHNYLPCRMFKNISYGQLGFTNVPKFKDIYGDTFIEGSSIAEMVDRVLALDKIQYLDITAAQQAVTKNHTYAHKLTNIVRALQEIK